MDTGFQGDKNTDTSQEGYFIQHAGSLWAGQCNKQNTIDEIIALTKAHRLAPFSSCRKSGGTWYFSGNFATVSNVFDVKIWNPRIARRVQRAIRANSLIKA